MNKIRRLISKGIHKVLGVERFAILLDVAPEGTKRQVGVLLDGKPDVKRGDFIIGKKKDEGENK
jgi:hypothetical protein